MEQYDPKINLLIVLKRNKYQQLSFLLSSIFFIQRESGSVHVYNQNQKPTNLLYRSIKEAKELIHQQNCQHHFYMNSNIIVSYHFIEQILTSYSSQIQILNYLKISGLRVGRNEVLNMITTFRNK